MIVACNKMFNKKKKSPVKVANSGRIASFKWDGGNLTEFGWLTRRIFKTCTPLLSSPDFDVPCLIQKFLNKAKKRLSDQRVVKDIELMAALHVKLGPSSALFRQNSTPEQLQVVDFYNLHQFSKTELTLDNFGFLFPYAFCQYVQSHPEVELRVNPNQISGLCPRFVCIHCFVYLIPRDPAYDHWMEWHLKYRDLYKTNAKRPNKAMLHELNRVDCIEKRRTGYLIDEDRVFFLKSLINMAIKGQPNSTGNSSPSSFTNSDDGVLELEEEEREQEGEVEEVDGSISSDNQIDDAIQTPPLMNSKGDDVLSDDSKKKVNVMQSDKSSNEPSQSLPVKRISLPQATIENLEFGTRFISWLTTEIHPHIDFGTKMEPSNSTLYKTSIFEDIDLYKIAEGFYNKAKTRTPFQVARDLAKMVAFYVERGSFVTRMMLTLDDDRFRMRSVNDFYDLKNRTTGLDLTLSRIAQIVPWLVCHYVELHGTEEEFPRPASEYPRYMVHHCFAALIPRNSHYDTIFEAHVKCRVTVNALRHQETLDREEIERRALLARNSAYLTDPQREEFLDYLEAIANSRQSN